MKVINVIVFFIFIISISNAQTLIKGKVTEKDKTAISGAVIKILNRDSSLVSYANTDSLGEFSLKVDSGKKFILTINYFGLKPFNKLIFTNSNLLNLGDLVLSNDTKVLKEVEVSALQNRGNQKEDTVQLNADAYKVNKDASAEDLVKKMPGVTSDNTGIKVHGETVQKVLVDGKPFFGDDPNASLKNLPAEIIDKVEFFDKMSDQASFSGFSDDNSQKTINLVTKKGKNIGQFGKIYAGAGADESEDIKYNAGFAVNSFKDKQRISVLGLFNNINQQNFSISDITGAMGNSNQGGAKGGQGGGARGMMGAQSNLLTGTQSGISETQAVGVNYSDEWSKKTSVSGSYFFNTSNSKNIAQTIRNYYSADKLIYNQNSNDNLQNQNHKINFRLESKLDSLNSVIVQPSFVYQKNYTSNILLATNTIFDTINSSLTTNKTLNNADGYDFNNSILWMHKFSKKFRTLSIDLATQLSEKNGNGDYVSENQFLGNLNVYTKQQLNQDFNSYNQTKKINPKITYTEPVFKRAQLQISYSPSYLYSSNNKITKDYDTLQHDYINQNVTLSNVYNNDYLTQRAGLGYKFQTKLVNINFGADAQSAALQGNQTFPVNAKVNSVFYNVLPNARFNYKIKKNNLRINYRTNTNIPNVTQLQEVLDISNALQPKIGNAKLNQTYEHNVFARYGGFNKEKQTNFMVFTSFNHINNNISSISTTIINDTVINGVSIKKGSLLNSYINLNNYFAARSFISYGLPLKKLKSNLNFNAGVNYNQTPSMANSILNYAQTISYNGGAFIGSNISENIDFSLSYNASISDLKNTVQKQANNQFVYQTIGLKCNFVFNRLVLNSDYNANVYSGLTQKFNQNFNLWNVYVALKLLKNKSLEAKLSVYDLLNQNASIGRTFNANYSEDFKNTALRRYVMFTLTYNFRNFKNGSVEPKQNKEDKPFMPNGGQQFSPH